MGLKHRKQFIKNIVKPVKPILDDQFLADIEEEVVGLFDRKLDFIEYDGSIKKGLIFTGDPGNGKTMTVRYLTDLVRQKHGIKHYNIDNSRVIREFNEGKLGELFKGQFLIFDDFDIDLFQRDQGKPSHQTCGMLTAMDGVDEAKNISIRIFTTNEEIEQIDPAFKRPGRIDRVFHFKKPTPELREKFVVSWKDSIKNTIKVQDIVEQSNGFSFAKLNELRNEIITCIIYSKEIVLENLIKNITSRYKNSDKGNFGFAT